MNSFDEDKTLKTIQDALEALQGSGDIEQDKINVLNEINAILYPLREASVIQDYQFSVKKSTEGIVCTVSITVNFETIEWDLNIQPN